MAFTNSMTLWIRIPSVSPNYCRHPVITRLYLASGISKKPAGFNDFLVLPGQGRYHNPLLKGPDDWQDANGGGKEYQGYVDDVITDQALNWLRNQDRQRPFSCVRNSKLPTNRLTIPKETVISWKASNCPIRITSWNGALLPPVAHTMAGRSKY